MYSKTLKIAHENSNINSSIDVNLFYFKDHIKLNKAQNLSALDVRGDHLCSDGSYLPASHWKCDGSKDCLDGTDEQNCTSNYDSSYFIVYRSVKNCDRYFQLYT